MGKIYKIIDKVNNKTYNCDDKITQGFLLDDILNQSEFIYEWVNYKVVDKGDDIIIEEKKVNNNEQRKNNTIY